MLTTFVLNLIINGKLVILSDKNTAWIVFHSVIPYDARKWPNICAYLSHYLWIYSLCSRDCFVFDSKQISFIGRHHNQNHEILRKWRMIIVEWSPTTSAVVDCLMTWRMRWLDNLNKRLKHSTNDQEAQVIIQKSFNFYDWIW